MSQTTAQQVTGFCLPLMSFSDVLASMGQITADRIHADPAPGLAVEADVVRVYRDQGVLCELIDGVLVEKPMGAYESWLAGEILAILRQFAMEHDLGIVLGEAGMLQLWPGRVRVPDVCFISWDQLPNRMFPRSAVPALHPDLAVEVLSDSNTPAEMHRKLHDYFKSGTRLVWYLDPDGQTMSVFTSPTQVKLVGPDGELDGRDVLPGFKLLVSKLFRVRRQQLEPEN